MQAPSHSRRNSCILWGCILPIGLVLLFGLVLVTVRMRSFIRDYNARTAPERVTEPLAAPVVADLCRILALDLTQDPRCQAADVYGFEFYPDFLNRYTPYKTSQTQIHGEIGKYLVGCSDWRWSLTDTGYFQGCRYDFKGDHALELMITFHRPLREPPKVNMWSICMPAIRNISLSASPLCNPPW